VLFRDRFLLSCYGTAFHVDKDVGEFPKAEKGSAPAVLRDRPPLYLISEGGQNGWQTADFFRWSRALLFIARRKSHFPGTLCATLPFRGKS
jgi:hypothetical protein